MIRLLASLVLTSLALLVSSHPHHLERCQENDRVQHPVLCSAVDHLLNEPSSVSMELKEWAASHGLLVDVATSDSAPLEAAIQRQLRGDSGKLLPVVFAHGMGDSCFNDGMQRIVEHTSQLLNGAYTVCIPTGDDQQEDTTNGYFLNMDASVEVWAEKVKQDPRLANGFNAIGFSQGNNIIRGYIAKYNNPVVNTFISVNGVNAGEGAVPYCRPESETTASSTLSFSMCDLLMEQASKAAYTEYSQKHSFQANYWRDPREVAFSRYQAFAQLANWNNEGLVFNQTLKDNFAKTNDFVWILAEDDGMVWPKEGEQWGAPFPKDPFNTILPREQTKWYKDDLFGLRTAEEAGKNHYESFPGDHLQFSMEDFDKWVTTYFA